MEAEALYWRAVHVFRRRLGKGHFEVGFNLGQLAALCHASDRLGEASRLYGRALRILRGVLGERHPVVALCLTNFAALRVAQRRAPEAQALYRQALSAYRSSMGAKHPDTLACAHDLAAVTLETRGGASGWRGCRKIGPIGSRVDGATPEACPRTGSPGQQKTMGSPGA